MHVNFENVELHRSKLNDITKWYTQTHRYNNTHTYHA